MSYVDYKYIIFFEKLNNISYVINLTTENIMDMIPQFQTLPEDIVNRIIMMTPWKGQTEYHKDCMDQLLNMRECLEDYQAGLCACPLSREKWLTYSYMRFALFKVRQKRELNRER